MIKSEGKPCMGMGGGQPIHIQGFPSLLHTTTHVYQVDRQLVGSCSNLLYARSTEPFAVATLGEAISSCFSDDRMMIKVGINSYQVRSFFIGYRENHRITPATLGGAADSVKLLLIKNLVCSLSCPSCRGARCLV